MLPVPFLNIIASFFVAGIITWLAIPRIVTVAKHRRLYDRPGQRKIHKYEIPTLGGIGIFSGFFVSLMLFVNGNIEHITIIGAGSMIIFLMGTKDDLVSMNPPKKLLVEFLVAFLIASATDIRFTSFHGFLGIETIPVWLSVCVTVFLIIVIMNSFNLIDGIDGLAASIGILSSLVYAIWFWLAGSFGYAVLAMAIAGSLTAFLPFNLYTGKFKIFMGDTGSLTIGLLLAILTIEFNELNALENTLYKFNSAPAISIGILFLPLFDTLRVMIVRMSKGIPPFRGDNNHLHHRMVRLGMSHKKATLVLVIANLFFIAFAILVDNLGILFSSLTILVTALLLTSVTAFFEYRNKWFANKSFPTEEEYHLSTFFKSIGILKQRAS